ncbi:hypothetical protein B0H19DRAFT_140163 [Mycena capillaripes]|nr:hypothetical protein B0H19DRAFT_140163 [Mycena capillaripes]
MLSRQLITTSSLVLTGRTCCAVSGSIVHLTLGFFSPLPVIPAVFSLTLLLYSLLMLFFFCVGALPQQSTIHGLPATSAAEAPRVHCGSFHDSEPYSETLHFETPSDCEYPVPAHPCSDDSKNHLFVDL